MDKINTIINKIKSSVKLNQSLVILDTVYTQVF